jgi:hydrogenase maturation protease
LKTLVLGLGNDILADDAVGVLAARALADRRSATVDVQETAEHGMALLDHLIGYERVILIDAIQTGSNEPGTILEIDPASLSAVYAPSPHYSGLPELLAVAEQLELDFPKHFRIFAVEIADALTIGGAITPAVREAIPGLCDRVRAALDESV